MCHWQLDCQCSLERAKGAAIQLKPEQRITMNSRKRKTILIGTMLVMLAIAAAWNVNWMMDQRDQARHAARQLAACRALAQQIDALRDQPAVASSEAIGVQELGQRLADAARKANLGDRRPRSVRPQSARRVGDSPYLRKPTDLALRGLSLQQTAAFLHHLTAASKLTVQDLRLRTPHGNINADTWNAEATLTYLVYEPASND